MSEFYFIESVSEGLPTKSRIKISMRLFDAHSSAGQTFRASLPRPLCNTGLVVLAGEITTSATVDYIQVARDTIKRIGYDNTEYGIDYKGCAGVGGV